jgi:hypothetical protein
MLFKKQIIHSIDVEEIELKVHSPTTPDDVVDELYRFGAILFSECLQRGSELDRKLTSMLGWSIAALASILLQHSRSAPLGTLQETALAIGTAAAFFSTLLAGLALKTTVWPAPSDADWFREGLWEDVQKLKRYHVISLLVTRQEHVKRIARKAHLLGHVELLLSLAALSISILLIS